MEDERVEAAVAAALKRIDAGDAADSAWLRREFPDCWETVAEVLALVPARRSETGVESIGPYRLLRKLGAGGMGAVYLAEVTRTSREFNVGSQVAVKTVHPHFRERAGAFKRFMREAEIGRSIRHANVVRTYDIDVTERNGLQTPFLVMEYVEGQTLRGLLAEMGTVPEELCRHVGREVARGLTAIHAAGAVHRDLKPENVLITPDHQVKIMDLGVARLADEALRLSQTGSFVGSVQYAAPESVGDGGSEADHRVDLHALGLVLYELSSGTNPYLAGSIPETLRRVLDARPRQLGELNPQLSAFFEEVVHTLLVKDPRGRFASATQLLTVLEGGEESSWWKDHSRALRAETRRPLRRIRIQRETAVYGRDADLAKLREFYDEAKSGDGQVVFLEGEAGIGKSRLVDEFVGRLQRDGEDVNFLFGSYPPSGAVAAHGAFSTAFREQFGEEGAGAYLTQVPPLIPAFDAVLRGEIAPEDSLPLNRDSLGTCFVHATRSLAAERTTIVLIDDLHFAPDDALGLFTTLAMAVPGHRILLLGTARPGVDAAWLGNLSRLEQVTHVELARLGAKDLAELLRDSFGSDGLARDLGMQIALKSDGNPFFVFEILRSLRDGRSITQTDDGEWVSTGDIDEIRIPSSVLDLVNARVAGLTEDERNLLDVACCWGYEFDPGLVGEVLGLARIPALRAFGQIERAHRLVRSSGRSYVFDHHQVQEALYGSINEQLREEYHRALAEALEARTRAAEKDAETLDGTLCVQLCEHYLMGARGEEALRYLDGALTHLVAGHSHAATLALTDRALTASGVLTGKRRVGVLLRRCVPGGPLDVLSLRERQDADARAALQLASDLDNEELRREAENAIGAVCYHASRLDEAEHAFEGVLASARVARNQKAEASATGNLGSVLKLRGRLSEAQAHIEKHLEMSRDLGDLRGEAKASSNLGALLSMRGHVAEALETYSRALTLSRQIGDRHGEAIAAYNLAVALAHHGRDGEAYERLEQGLALCRRIGFRQGEAANLGTLGNLMLSQGRHAEARHLIEQHLKISHETGYREGVATATGNLGTVQAHVGRWSDAFDLFSRNATLSRETGNRLGEAVALGNMASALLSLGRLAAARARHEEALELCREIGARRSEAYACVGLGKVLMELGIVELARTHLLDGLALADADGARRLGATTRLALAAVERVAGSKHAAIEWAASAREMTRDAGLPGIESLALCHLALPPGGGAAGAREAVAAAGDLLSVEDRCGAHYLLWLATGDKKELQRAWRRLDQLVSMNPDHRDSMLTNLRVNREIMAACKEHGI